MGSSVSAPMAGARQQAWVLAFFKKHYRPWTALAERDPPYSYLDQDRVVPHLDMCSGPSDDLSCDDRRFKVGFDYPHGIQGGERDYVFAVCRFIAEEVLG